VVIGQAAIGAYVDGIPGRLMRSLKSVLGTSLVEETTLVGREQPQLRDVIAFLSPRGEAPGEQAAGCEFRSVVHGRPCISSTMRRRRPEAEETLRGIVREIGFDHSPSSSNRSRRRWITNVRSPARRSR